MAKSAVHEETKRPVAKEADLRVFPVRRPFEYAEIMERSIVWPGDED
jgi:hypothetical protein